MWQIKKSSKKCCFFFWLVNGLGLVLVDFFFFHGVRGCSDSSVTRLFFQLIYVSFSKLLLVPCTICCTTLVSVAKHKNTLRKPCNKHKCLITSI